MPDDLDEHTKLLARADAAVAQARRLIEANREWQNNIEGRMRRMLFRATFAPKSLKLFSPWDVRAPERSSQPFPAQPDET